MGRCDDFVVFFRVLRRFSLIQDAHREFAFALVFRQLVKCRLQDEAVALPFHHVRRAAFFVLASKRDRAGRDRLDQAEAVVLDRFGDDVNQDRRVVGGGAGDKSRAGCLGQFRDVEAALDRAVRRRRRFGVGRRQRRILAAGHAVNVVVEQDNRDVDVAAGRMDEVVAANRGGVAVARADDDVQFRLGELDAGGNRQRPAVGRVDGVEVQVAGGAARAADAGYDGRLVLVQAEFINRFDNGAGDDAVAAARTPDMGQASRTEILFY